MTKDHSPLSSESTKRIVSTIMASLLRESDRGCVIYSAAILDEELESLIRAYCRTDKTTIRNFVDPLFKGYGPLAGFSAKIKMCYAMNLISRKLRGQLDVLRRMRNEFAHDKAPLDFSDNRCRKWLDILTNDGKPSINRNDPGGDIVHKIGTQMLTKSQAVDRIAFAMVVAAAAGVIAFRKELIEKIKTSHPLGRIMGPALMHWLETGD